MAIGPGRRTWQLELRPLHASLALEVVALGIPMARDGNRAINVKGWTINRRLNVRVPRKVATHFRYDLSSTSSLGSRAEGSVHSMTSGWATSVLSSATLNLCGFPGSETFPDQLRLLKVGE